MANIENLNFQVILNDDDFRSRVQTDIEKAKELDDAMTKILHMRINSKPLITAAGVTNAQNMSKYLDEISTKLQNMPKGALFVGDAEKLNATLAQINATLEKMNTKQKTYTGSVQGTNAALFNAARLIRTLSTLTGAAFSVAGLRRFLSSLVEITGQFEVQRMALRSMLKDVDGADKIFEDLYRFSSDSTYRFSELAKYAKQLAAFQIGKNDLLETTKMLGDVASGVGVSMDRLILAYGHVKSSGFLRGIQLRSFSQNGVPILEELSKMLTEIEGKAVSLGDVFDKMTRREIPFEMVEQAFKRMTSEGGQFYQMQEVLAKTLAGQINILKGRWENMLAAIGQANSGVLKNAVSSISNLIANYEKVGQVIKELIAIFGIYQASLFAATWVVNGLAAAINVGLVGALKKLYTTISTWIASNPLALLAAAATAVAVAVYKVRTATTAADRIFKTASDSMNKYKVALAEESVELERLYAKLNLAKKGTEEYASAKAAIEKRFGPYIEQLRAEGVAVNDLAAVYENLAGKIRDANKAKFLESATDDITKTFGSEVDQILETFRKTYAHLSATAQEDIWNYIVTGQLQDKSLEKELYRTPGGTVKSLGAYGMMPAAVLREDYVDAANAFDLAMSDVERALKVTTAAIGDNHTALKDWRKTVQDTLYGLDQDFEKTFMPKESEDYFEYLERIGKHYKEVNEYKDKALEKDKQIYQRELDAIKKVDAALEGNILKDVRYSKTPWRGSGSGDTKNPFADEISDTNSAISLLEKFKSAYDKLEPILGADGAKAWVFENMGKDVSNLDKEFEALIAHLRTLGDEGVEAADAAEARLGLDKASKAVKEYNAAQKALEEYERAFEKFDKDWGEGDQEGAGYKVEKAFRDYNNEDKKIDDDYLDAQMKAFEAHKDNVDAIKEETDELERLYKSRKKANKAKLKETVRGLADDIFKEQMKGFDLTDWNDKTIWQINEIREAIEQVEIPEDIKKELEGDTEAANALMIALNELKQKTLNNTVDPEMFKKVSKEAKRLAGYLATASDKMRELAIATGNTKMGDFAEVVGMLAQNMQAAADGAEAWGGWWGAIIGGLTDLFDQAITGITDAIKASKEMEKIVREIKTDAFVLSNTKLFSNNSIFGDADAKNVRGAVEAMKNLRENMVGLGDPEIKQSLSMWQKARLGWNLFFKKNVSSLDVEKQGKLSDVMSRLGLNVYDENGNFDAASIREVIKLFGDESGALEQLAKDSEAYAEAVKVVDDVAESLVGDIPSDITDKIVDSWWEAGEAALDYADVLGDVAKAYAKLIVQDMLMETAFDEDRQKAFKEAMKKGDVGRAMSIVEGAMQSAVSMLPAVDQALQVLEPYRNIGSESLDTNSVGNGIRGITEDTANLLASYINAIRDDVSTIRKIQETGNDNVNLLGESIPTLNEHLAQIAATNFDIAQSNQSILAELRSVIGAPGTSGMVVRVEAY